MRLDPNVPITVATKNPDKFREIAFVWDDFRPPLVMAGPELPEVDERFDTYEENAIVKARALADFTSGPALADDSGIEVSALCGAPGVRSARRPSPDASPQDRNAHILAQLAEISDRRARFVCVCALVVPGFDTVVTRGEVHGLIADSPRGDAGFGYDPIFYYPPYGCTFAEAGSERKNAVSHRGRAVRALRKLVANFIPKS